MYLCTLFIFWIVFKSIFAKNIYEYIYTYRDSKLSIFSKRNLYFYFENIFLNLSVHIENSGESPYYCYYYQVFNEQITVHILNKETVLQQQRTSVCADYYMCVSVCVCVCRRDYNITAQPPAAVRPSAKDKVSLALKQDATTKTAAAARTR